MFNLFKKNKISKKIVYIIIFVTLLIGIIFGFLFLGSFFEGKDEIIFTDKYDKIREEKKEELDKYNLESNIIEGYVKLINNNTLVFSDLDNNISSSSTIVIDDKTEIFLQKPSTVNEREINDDKRFLQIKHLQDRLETLINEEEKNEIQAEIDILLMAQVDEPAIIEIELNEIKINYYIKILESSTDVDSNLIARKIILENINYSEKLPLSPINSNLLIESDVY